MKIQTVDKIIPAGNINIVDGHAHVWANFKGTDKIKSDFIVDNMQLIEKSLLDFRENEGSLVMDCTPYGCGRDAGILCGISKKTDLSIVCVTGFHRREYYLQDHAIWAFNLKEAQEFFMGEINTGVTETLKNGIRPKAAVIKIAFLGVLEDKYKTLTEAAVLASIKTGAPLLIHTEQGINVEWFADYLEEKGIRPDKVVFCHVDKRPDIKFHEKLAARGYFLEYDTFLREKYEPEKTTYKLIDAMVKNGYSNSIIIGSDIAGNTMWEKVGAMGGYGGFFRILKQRFLNYYSDPEVTAGMLSGNAVRFLSMPD